MRNTPGTAHECSPDFLPQTEEIGDVTDTYPNMEPAVEMSSEQPNSSPTNSAVPNTNYVINRITRNLFAMTTIDIELSAELVCSTECARRRPKNSKNALRSIYLVRRNFWNFYVLAIHRRLTHLLLSPDYFETRPLILISTISFFISGWL